MFKKPEVLNGLLRLPAAALQKVRTTCRYFDLLSRFENAILTCQSTGESSPNDRGKFLLSRGDLVWLVGKHDLGFLERIGGVRFVASALETYAETGIRGDDEDIRRRVKAFGSNSNPELPLCFPSLLSNLYKASVRLLLLVCLIGKCFLVMKGYYTEEGMDYPSLINTGLRALNLGTEMICESFLESLCMGWLKDVQYGMADVVRSGKRKWFPASDIVVGDIVYLKGGDRVPADGLLLDGGLMLVDPIPSTGKEGHRRIDCRKKPFLHAGDVVEDGLGTMLVTSVGTSKKWGVHMRYIDSQRLETRLQSQMEDCTRNFGVILTFLLTVIFFARNFTGNSSRIFVRKAWSSPSTLDALAGIFHVVTTHVYIAIPICWHLIPPLSFSSYLKEPLKQGVFLRDLRVTETMSLAKTICLDKTGILTLNRMLVTDFLVGLDTIYEDTDSLVSPYQVHPLVLDLIIHGLALNTTCSITRQSSESPFQVSGSPIETALLSWTAQNLHADVDRIRQRYSITMVAPFRTQRLRSEVVVKNNVDGSMDTHCKGDAETILALSSQFYTINGTLRSLNVEERMSFCSVIQAMSAKGLRCIALAHKQVSTRLMNEGKDFSLLGILGISDQCRSGSKDMIRLFQHAGLDVKVITSDNILNAKAIATECGILATGDHVVDGAIIEGREFRSYTPEERQDKVDRIQVLVGATPKDKLLMIKCLQKKGPVIAMTGGGTDDRPALEEADVGISMYFCGTEFSQESSDMVVFDDDIASVMDLLRHSRCLYSNFHKLVELQLTFMISALAINFMCVIISGSIALSEVHLLWARTIIFILGHTALAAQKPANYIRPMPPLSEAKPLVKNITWRNVIVQASYQVIILVFLHYNGKQFFGVSEQELEALLFNIFILCQLFNLFNFKFFQGMNMFNSTESIKLFFSLLIIVIGIHFAALESVHWTPHRDGLSMSSKGWGASITIMATSYLFGGIGGYIPVHGMPFPDNFGWKCFRRDLQLAESQNSVPETPFVEYLWWRWFQIRIEQAGSQVGDAAWLAFSRWREMMGQMGVISNCSVSSHEGVAEAYCMNTQGLHRTDESNV